MHDPRCVGVCQSLGDLPRDRERVPHGQRALPVQARLQGLARVKRHRQEQLTVVGLPDFVDGAEVRVIERGGRMRLLEEARLGRGIEARLGQEELERDGPAQTGVLGAVDHAHASGTEPLHHPEVRDRATGQAQRIGRGRGGGEERSLERSEPLIGLAIGGQQDLDGLAQCAIGGAERRKTAGLAGLIERDQLVEGGLDLFPAAGIHTRVSEAVRP